MKRLAITTLILCASIVNSTAITYAKENSVNSNITTSITQSSKDNQFSQEDYTSKMQKEIFKSGVKVISSSEKFIRISRDSKNSNVTIKEFTKDTYKQQMEKDKLQDAIDRSSNGAVQLTSNVPIINNEYNKYDWIKLSLQVYKNSDGSYSATGFYEWKNQPRVVGAGDEIIALTHDSNSTFNFSTARAEAHNPNTYSGEQVTSEDSHNKNFNSSTNGIAFSTPLTATKYNAKVVPYGLITTKLQRVNSSSNIVFEYAHKQIPTAVSPSINIGPVGLSISSEYAYDKANTGVLVQF